MFDTMESKISRLAVFFLVISTCLQLCVVCIDNRRIQIIETAPAVTTEVIGDEDDAMIAIIETAPSDLLIKEGESSTLSCTSDHPWFFCVWVHPSGSKKCSLAEEGEYKSVCEGMENIRIRGDGNTCQLDIMNITQEDHGEYMCLLSQAEVFHTDRVFVNVEVATPANLSIRKVGDQEDSTMLDMVEGETVELVCEVTGAYPPPTFLWNFPDHEGVQGENVFEEEYPGHTITGVSSVYYTAEYSHSGHDIQCLTMQTQGDSVIYTSMAKTIIHVRTPMPLNSSQDHQEVVTGVFISGLLIILCLSAVVLSLIVRRRKYWGHKIDKLGEDGQLGEDDQLGEDGHIGEDGHQGKHCHLTQSWTTRLKKKVNNSFIMEDEGIYSKPYTTSTPHRKDDSSCRADIHDSESSNNSHFTSSLSECTLSDSLSLGDIVEGNFVSFSQADMYCCGVYQDILEDQDIIVEEDEEEENINTTEQETSPFPSIFCQEVSTHYYDKSQLAETCAACSESQVKKSKDEKNTFIERKDVTKNLLISHPLSDEYVNNTKEYPCLANGQTISKCSYNQTANECPPHVLSKSIITSLGNPEVHVVHNSISDDTVNISLRKCNHNNCSIIKCFPPEPSL